MNSSNNCKEPAVPSGNKDRDDITVGVLDEAADSLRPAPIDEPSVVRSDVRHLAGGKHDQRASSAQPLPRLA